jgi:hypothetical protein
MWSAVLSVTVIVCGIIVTLLWLVIAWRAMEAHERIAGCMQAALRILEQQATGKPLERPKMPE